MAFWVKQEEVRAATPLLDGGGGKFGVLAATKIEQQEANRLKHSMKQRVVDVDDRAAASSPIPPPCFLPGCATLCCCNCSEIEDI